MRRNVFKALILLFLLILLFTFREERFSSNGSHDFSIQEAIDAAQPGDTILVGKGIFFEQLFINKSLKLIGEGCDKTILDGEGKGTGITVRTASDVVIKGFKIQNSAYYGIIIQDSWNVTVADNNVTMCYSGMLCENVSYSHIENNVFRQNFGSGILLIRSNHNRIVGNEVAHHTPFGVYIYDSHGNVVNENYLAFICQGIRLENASKNEVARNFLEKNSPYGIKLVNSYENTLTENYGINNTFGIFLENSERNHLEANVMAFQARGIYFFKSMDNRLRNNNLTGNWLCNFGVRGDELSHFVNDIDSTNTVDGKPIRYLIGERNVKVPEDAGFVAVVNSSDIIAENLDLTGNMHGIVLAYSETVVVRNSSFCNNHGEGMYITHTNNCRVEGNDIKGNIVGIWLEHSWNNQFFHNNFADNKQTIEVDAISQNVWDNGYPSGGNYWEAYDGIDANYDGIGDTPYRINGENVDNYPLAGKTFQFLAFENETVKHTVKFVSNVTVSNFSFNTEKQMLECKVTANNKTLGFCRIAIPKTFFKAQNLSEWIVEINNQTLRPDAFEDPDTTYLYFQFNASETSQTILITTRGKETLLDSKIVLLTAAVFAIGSAAVIVLWKVRPKIFQTKKVESV